MFLPLLALDFHLNPMTRAIDRVHFFLANEFFSRHIAVGVVYFLESIERILVAGLGRNLPVTDSNFIVAKVAVFFAGDIVAGDNASSQCANLIKQSGPFLIDGYSDALLVASPNPCASFRRTEFSGPSVAIKGFEFVFGCVTTTIPVK